MYHKLTIYVKSRYQTNIFPSCCFGDQYHKYEHHSIILNRISDNLVTNPNQFGFKPKHNTEMCIFALKEAILKYRALNSNVYSCFLDASKAFDRVNHSKLFDTLVKRGVPFYIIRIIRFWYTSQTMYVRWNNVMSSGFNVSNGVRQGGILSPYPVLVLCIC